MRHRGRGMGENVTRWTLPPTPGIFVRIWNKRSCDGGVDKNIKRRDLKMFVCIVLQRSLQVLILKGLRSDFPEVRILQGLAGEGCGARSGCCVITAHVSTVVHALQEVSGENWPGEAGHSNGVGRGIARRRKKPHSFHGRKGMRHIVLVNSSRGCHPRAGIKLEGFRHEKRRSPPFEKPQRVGHPGWCCFITPE